MKVVSSSPRLLESSVSDARTGRDGTPKRSARQSWLLIRVALITSVALGAAALPGGSPHAAARVAAAPVSRPVAVATAAAHGRLVPQASTPAEAQAQAQAAAAAPDAPPRTVVHTMSLDAPIQGGLTAHQEQALSARLRAAHQTPAAAPQSEYWTPAMGLSAVARADSWLGMPYSWAGGDSSGPTPGRCDTGTGGDLDCHVIGFDCSGLTMYAWGAYLSLPHLAAAQSAAGGFHPTVKQLLPGDLVLFSGYIPGGTGHIAVYAGSGMVIEAPQSGAVVHRAALADLIAEDGYRGAVRPLTGPTPTLTAPGVAVPAAGETLTLHGQHLAGVDAVHVGGMTVRQFEQHSDAAIVFRAPAHAPGAVAVTVSTSWQAQSRQVSLTYVRPHPAAPAPRSSTAPRSPTSSPTAPPSSSTPPSTHSSTHPSTPPTSAAVSLRTTVGAPAH
jgi:cell wall-associated NlpC family hydrolase